MADYLTRTFSRALNQLLLLFGGMLLLAFLLCAVAGQIRGAGESVLGRGYYYLVAPGVVCHETGHALGCLMTGTKIIRFEPFRIRGNVLGQVVINRNRRDALGQLSNLLIGFGPIWFGCLMIWVLTKLFSRRCSLPDFETMFPLDPAPSSWTYWTRTFKASWLIFKTAFTVWKWGSTLNVIYLYLIFCIASEMGLSFEDLSCTWVGFAMVSCGFLVLNAIPYVGVAMSGWVFRFSRKLFPVHALMLFVLIVDFLFVVLFVWPLKFLF